MSACIYCIKNKINGHCYIGQTIDYSGRISKHRTELRGNRHCNMILQRAYNKYGEDAFEASIIEYVDDYSKIGERERYWIDQLGYYNIDKGREGFTPIALRNMSEAHKGKISPRRVVPEDVAIDMLAISEFCDGAVRKMVTLTGYSRQSLKGIAAKETYQDIVERYDKLTFSERLQFCTQAIEKYDYKVWENSNCVCPKKNAYVYFLGKQLDWNCQQMGLYIPLSHSVFRRYRAEINSGRRKIDTTFSEEEIKQILKVFCIKKTMPWE